MTQNDNPSSADETKLLSSQVPREVVFNNLDTKSLLRFGATCTHLRQETQEILQKRQETEKYLTHVARGEQREAEAMLDTKPWLLTARGKLIDYGNREFSGVTGVDYVRWAYDREMYDMMMGKMLEHCSSEMPDHFTQYHAVMAANQHGQHYNFTGLKGAYADFVMGLNDWRKNQDWGAISRAWNAIGDEQLNMPAHIAQHFCRPDRNFKTDTLDFTKEDMHNPRVLDVITSQDESVHWWSERERWCVALRGGMETARAASKDNEREPCSSEPEGCWKNSTFAMRRGLCTLDFQAMTALHNACDLEFTPEKLSEKYLSHQLSGLTL